LTDEGQIDSTLKPFRTQITAFLKPEIESVEIK